MRNGAYRADLAHRKYQERLEQKPKSHKFTEQIKETIHRLLEEDFSPKQIVGRCKLERKPCVSREQIYQYVWEDKRHKGKLYLHLHHRGRKYRRRGAAKGSCGRMRDTMSIDLRPPEVELKKRFGDLEMDTVVGKNHKGAILTINDRSTKLCWIRLLTGREESKPLKAATVATLMPIKDQLKTITVARKEFAAHLEISDVLNVPIYFAHPYHSWERGANENMNGLICQYLPKGSSFLHLAEESVWYIQERLNNRPRKMLGYLTPKEYALANSGIEI